MSRDARNLRELQELLYRLITAPNGVAAGLETAMEPLELEEMVAGDERLNAVDRIGIYADAYFYRLFETFKEDFPAVQAMIGADQFHNLITGYLLDYPPADPSLLYAGEHLADYLGRARGFARWPWLADLARLERALIDSFHAANARTLDRAAMQSIAPAAWPSVHLRLHPAVRLMRASWRVDEVARAIRGDGEIPAPRAEAIAVIVWRSGTQVNYRAVEPFEAIALDSIEAEADFAAICTAVAEAADGEDVAWIINRLLARWLADGVLLGQPEDQDAPPS